MTDTTADTLARSFATGFAGITITPDSPDYDTARVTWNAMVGRRPALIARCRDTADVVSAVNLAREAGVPLAVRGGGHSVAGLSGCDDGVVIDLSPMREVRVDPERRIASCGGGTRWGDFDAATGAHGLATTGGQISTTGVAGLTLGGGLGWLQRRYGLTCDNLVGAELVTAAGDVIQVDDTRQPDLMWGLRGGGGNFGVVTRFDFRVHPVGTVLAGLMAFPLARGREVLTAYRSWAAGLPDEWSTAAAIVTAPPAPFVPPEFVGQKIVAMLGCYCGEIETGMASLDPMRALSPAIDGFGPMPYPALQRMLDDGTPPGLRSYFRAGSVAELSDDVIDVVLAHGARLPSPLSQIHFHHMGGAVDRVPPGATACSGRNAGYTYNIISLWMSEAEDAVNIGANRALATAFAPLAETGTTYVNFVSEVAGADRVRHVYGDATYRRLARLKAAWDPTNLFRINQNIAPAA